jgi:hypothetical protein
MFLHHYESRRNYLPSGTLSNHYDHKQLDLATVHFRATPQDYCLFSTLFLSLTRSHTDHFLLLLHRQLGCDEFTLTREQIEQKRAKRARVEYFVARRVYPFFGECVFSV